MAGGVITLGEMRTKGMTMLEVACRRCERRGRLRIERGSGVLDLRAIIAADGPRMRNPSTSIYHRCGVEFPELPRWFLTGYFDCRSASSSGYQSALRRRLHSGAHLRHRDQYSGLLAWRAQIVKIVAAIAPCGILIDRVEHDEAGADGIR